MQLVIEKGIPLPPTKTPGLTAAISQLEPGDSVLLPVKQIQSANSLVRQFRQKPGMAERKFACRTVDGGVRVWRVE